MLARIEKVGSVFLLYSRVPRWLLGGCTFWKCLRPLPSPHRVGARFVGLVRMRSWPRHARSSPRRIAGAQAFRGHISFGRTVRYHSEQMAKDSFVTWAASRHVVGLTKERKRADQGRIQRRTCRNAHSRLSRTYHSIASSTPETSHSPRSGELPAHPKSTDTMSRYLMMTANSSELCRR